MSYPYSSVSNSRRAKDPEAVSPATDPYYATVETGQKRSLAYNPLFDLSKPLENVTAPNEDLGSGEVLVNYLDYGKEPKYGDDGDRVRRRQPGFAGSTSTWPTSVPAGSTATAPGMGARPSASGPATASWTTTSTRTSTAARVLDSLRVTAADEFFHAIQFGYDVDADPWSMEGTATWVEDEVHDHHQRQLPVPAPTARSATPRSSVDNSVGLHRYGTFLFFEYAAQVLADRGAVRRMWEAADAGHGRTRSRRSRAVISQRMSWPVFLTMFGAWNTLPRRAAIAIAPAYPAPALTLNRTLSRTAPSTGWRSVIRRTCPARAIRVAPHAALGVRKRLLVEVNAPDLARGVRGCCSSAGSGTAGSPTP